MRYSLDCYSICLHKFADAIRMLNVFIFIYLYFIAVVSWNTSLILQNS